MGRGITAAPCLLWLVPIRVFVTPAPVLVLLGTRRFIPRTVLALAFLCDPVPVCAILPLVPLVIIPLVLVVVTLGMVVLGLDYDRCAHSGAQKQCTQIAAHNILLLLT